MNIIKYGMRYVLCHYAITTHYSTVPSLETHLHITVVREDYIFHPLERRIDQFGRVTTAKSAAANGDGSIAAFNVETAHLLLPIFLLLLSCVLRARTA